MSRPFAIGQPSASSQKTAIASTTSTTAARRVGTKSSNRSQAAVTARSRAPTRTRLEHSPLERPDPLLQAVDAIPERQPHVGLEEGAVLAGERGRPHDVRLLERFRRRTGRTALTEAECAEAVTKPDVQHVLAGGDSGVASDVVDHERGVEVVQPAGAVGPVRLGHVTGDALLGVASRERRTA